MSETDRWPGMAEPDPESHLTLREETAFIFAKLAGDLALEGKRPSVALRSLIGGGFG